MANFKLSQTSGIDLLTTFRFAIHIAKDDSTTALGLKDDISAYIQQCDLPVAPGDPLIWHLPGGMKNYQAGKRTVQPVNVVFVVASNAGQGSVLTLLEKWAGATYDLDTGTNIGKAKYCTDAISIHVKGEGAHDSADADKYVFRLLRAQVTSCNYGQLSSEGNDLLKVSATFIYDNYQVTNGAGQILRTLS